MQQVQFAALTPPSLIASKTSRLQFDTLSPSITIASRCGRSARSSRAARVEPALFDGWMSPPRRLPARPEHEEVLALVSDGSPSRYSLSKKSTQARWNSSRRSSVERLRECFRRPIARREQLPVLLAVGRFECRHLLLDLEARSVPKQLTDTRFAAPVERTARRRGRLKGRHHGEHPPQSAFGRPVRQARRAHPSGRLASSSRATLHGRART